MLLAITSLESWTFNISIAGSFLRLTFYCHCVFFLFYCIVILNFIEFLHLLFRLVFIQINFSHTKRWYDCILLLQYSILPNLTRSQPIKITIEWLSSWIKPITLLNVFSDPNIILQTLEYIQFCICIFSYT